MSNRTQLPKHELRRGAVAMAMTHLNHTDPLILMLWKLKSSCFVVMVTGGGGHEIIGKTRHDLMDGLF